ncbi:hypothetical protein [Streptomyces sp. NPDC059071]|uniref:hypothetical protein n=1 Tax=unclassified Streptomyces TaxID=2593676 RepID=UPI00363A51D0
MSDAEIVRKIDELKSQLTKADSGNLVTDSHLGSKLPEKWAERFKSMYDELTKAKKSEFLEAMGLDGFGAALEKYYESRGGNDTKWGWYLASAIAGLIVPAIGALLVAQMINLSRKLQTLGNPDRPVWTGNGNGGFMRQHIDEINRREDRVFNGGAAITDLPNENATRRAREELEKLLEKITAFNRKSGSFRTKFNRMPSARELKRSAKGVEAIAKALEKITPEDVATMATNAGNLKTALDDFKPGKIPQDLQATRTETRNLGRTVDELKTSFQQLKEEVQAVNRVLV